VDLEGHGRENLFDDVDVSRTVGWFTTQFPLLLEQPEANNPGKTLEAVKKTLAAVPQNGIGLGILRYLDQKKNSAIHHMPRAGLLFNYLGQVDQEAEEHSWLQGAPESTGPQRAPENPRSHALEINAIISGGQLRMNWSCNSANASQDRAPALAQTCLDELRRLIHALDSADPEDAVPGILEDSGLSQEELDALADEIGLDDLDDFS
jgi:non-ribosomal peptide synthase protein (TIGR01720 family)